MNPLPENLQLYGAVALSLGIGLMFGVERGWRQRELPDGARAAGVRTFALIGLLGGVAGALGTAVGDLMATAMFIALASAVIAAHVTGVDETKDRSITTLIAALLTFALGVLAVRGDMVLAAAVAVVAVALLDLRDAMHGWIQRIDKAELSAAIKLLLISVVVLPVLPDLGYGPGGVLNPFELWWMVVLVASISFVGMAAIRVVGPRHGLLMTGALGGLASSTAVTLTSARLAAAVPAVTNAAAAAIAAASAASLARTVVLATVLSPAVGAGVASVLIPGVLGAVAAMFIHLRRQPEAPGNLPVLDFGPSADLGLAIKFGLFLAGFSVVAWYVGQQLGDAGVIGAAAVSGLIDVDAVTVSLSRQGPAALAARGILAAVAVNVFVKAVYAAAIAGHKILIPMAATTAATFVGMAAGMLLLVP
jgi:uncharacterized membrane protein (DUF4010 family)